jgi:predicted acyl esterase
VNDTASRRLPIVVFVALATSSTLALATSDCTPGPAPYANLAGATLVPEVHTSNDPDPVRYVRWRGTVPTFDGMPLSVDVTVPCGDAQPRPAIVMLHGFTDDKTIWEETGKSDTVHSLDRPGSNDRWNNIWFASRGYVVVNYTARGWNDSCGPKTPGHSVAAPAPQCAPYAFWIHLDDKRWEVRDAQWLAGGLVQSGHADAARLAITGGSYGGAPTVAAALLADRMMCGGAPVPVALGPDPCAGKKNGALVRWRTPDGRTPLTWAAAVPMYTFSDLLQVLAPNGRSSDGWRFAPRDRKHTRPFGVPLETTVSGLLLVAQLTGSVAAPGSDPDADIVTASARLLAGNPFPRRDPEIAADIRLYKRFKSPITTRPHGRVPIFWVGGLTDALFPAFEPLTLLRRIQAARPSYPFKLFLGDLGHDYAAERKDEWDLVKPEMHAFVDHYLRPDRTPQAPRFDVGATFTRCLDHDAPARAVHALRWHDLHPAHVTFVSNARGETSTEQQGPAGVATDPITTATLPGAASYKGCRMMRPSVADPTVVTYEFPVQRTLDVMGGPVVAVTLTATGPDVPLSVRLWDVAADRSVQGLVTRGTYRVRGPVRRPRTSRFQLAPQGYQFPAGQIVKVEVTANDTPYMQKSNVPAHVSVRRVALTLPLYQDRSQ